MSIKVFLTLLVSSRALLVCGYSSGPPATACLDMMPRSAHGTVPASGPAPFSLTVSNYSYNPGDVLQVTLAGTGGAQFKGFLIAARAASGQSTANIGTFTAITDSKVMCAVTTGNAVSHQNPSVKSTMTFDWTAPSSLQGDLVFEYTVVRGGAPNTASNPPDFFPNLKSSVVKGPTVTQFPKDPECGKTKGCYSRCTNNNCDWEISWKDSGTDYDFSLKATFTGDDKYVAVGFSGNGKMYPASVLVCMTFNSTVNVKAAFNPGYSVSFLTNPSEGINNPVTSYANGILHCNFTRVTDSNNAQIYNLSKPWYLITAKGNVNTASSLAHHTDRFFTSSAIDLSLSTTDESMSIVTTTPPSATTTPAAPANKFTKDPACGSTKGCFSNCADNVCDLLLAWAKKGNQYEMTLKSGFSGAGDHYIALGLSGNGKMNDASVVACTVVGGNVNASASFNPAYYNQLLPNRIEGLSSITGSYTNGVLECTFLREISSITNNQIYDMNKEWHIITARGVASSDGSLTEHPQNEAFSSSSKINFADPSVDISLEALEYPLVKAHACLMILAWMMSASIGLAMARFFKKQWPDDKLCDVKIWFAIHRGSMVLAFLMGISAFVIIFVEVDGYSDIPGETFKKAHPVLGIIVTSLLFINPFMSLLRCAPDDPKRPYFNYAHWAVGTSAHILGGVTITLGLYLPKAQIDSDVGLILMLVYFAWHICFFVVMTVLDCLSNAKPSKTVANSGPPIELTGKGYDLSALNASGSMDLPGKSSSLEPPYSSAKKWIFCLHVLILTGLSVTLVYLIIEGNN